MAFVNLQSSIECAATEGWWDCTHRRFEPILADLLPRGRAWDRDDPVLRQLVAAVGTELSRVDLRTEKLLREFDPATAFESIGDWETMLGLPDCAQPDTLDGRRKAIAAKLLAQTGHDQSLSYWTQLVLLLGYQILWVAKAKAVLTCVDDCNDQMFTDEWEFVWELVVDAGLNDALLECVVQHQALIETLALVHYAWLPVDVPPGVESIRGIACTMNGYPVAVGTSDLVLRASADLATWTAEVTPDGGDHFCVCHGGSQGKRLITAGLAGRVMYSDDGGDTWQSAGDDSAVTSEVYGLSRGPLADAVVVAVGQAGKTWRSTDAGNTWALVASPVAVDLRAVTRCKGALLAVGESRKIIRSSTNGASWTDVSPPGGTEALRGVSAWVETVIAVGAGGLILRSSDAGMTWATVTSPTAAQLLAVTSSPAGRWTACGAGGVILQSLDDGKTWTARKSPTSVDLYAAGVRWPDGRAVVAGNNRTIILE